MVGHGGSSAGSYLADPTSPIPSHCASIVVTSTVRVKHHLCTVAFTIYFHTFKVSIHRPVLLFQTTGRILQRASYVTNPTVSGYHRDQFGTITSTRSENGHSKTEIPNEQEPPGLLTDIKDTDLGKLELE